MEYLQSHRSRTFPVPILLRRGTPPILHWLNSEGCMQHLKSQQPKGFPSTTGLQDKALRRRLSWLNTPLSKGNGHIGGFESRGTSANARTSLRRALPGIAVLGQCIRKKKN